MKTRSPNAPKSLEIMVASGFLSGLVDLLPPTEGFTCRIVARRFRLVLLYSLANHIGNWDRRHVNLILLRVQDFEPVGMICQQALKVLIIN